MKPPVWLHSATVWLIIYDSVAVGLFIWLKACGYLARRKREGERMRMRMEMEVGRGAGRQTLIEGEIRRLGMW
jgi:hypothetical protein